MLRAFFILIFIFALSSSVQAETTFDLREKQIKETYKLQGTVEYDDNPIEVIYLDENIERPQVNIPKRSLTLPVGVLMMYVACPSTFIREGNDAT